MGKLNPPSGMAALQENQIYLFSETDGVKTRTTMYSLQSIAFSLNPATGLATATFNTPQNLNALRALQVWEMFLILEHAAQDPAVRTVLWTAAGRAFNAGADWNGKDQEAELAAALSEELREAYLKRGMGLPPDFSDLACKALTLAFWDFPKPSVCAVNGLAVGGGANMALANYHDYVVLSEKAKFLWPFSKLGLTPELGSSSTMPQIVGMLRAKQLLMTNDWCDATTAVSFGLANEVVLHDDLMQRATEVATKFATSNLTALSLSKAMMHKHGGRQELADVLDEENRTIMIAFTSEETKARTAAATAAAKKAKAAKAAKSKL